MKKTIVSLFMLAALAFGAVMISPDGDPPPTCLPIVGCQ